MRMGRKLIERCRKGVGRNDDRNDDKRAKKYEARHDSSSHRASSCPSWDRTRTLLIQSQACCQLHQGAQKPNTAPSHCSGSRNLTALSAIGSQLEPYDATSPQEIRLRSPQPRGIRVLADS